MGLLAQLGLAAPASLTPPLRGAPPSGFDGGAPSFGASAGATATAVAPPPVKSKVMPASAPATGQDPLGPPADGPDLEQLYELRGPDGRTTLDASNSKAGAGLNDKGKSLAFSFGSTAETYAAWLDKFQTVMKQATLSEQQLKKMKAGKAAATQSMGRDDMRGKSTAYVADLDAVQKSVRDVGPLAIEATAAVKHVAAIFARRDQNAAEHKRDAAKEKLDDRKEEIKEEQERFKSALNVVTKLADVEEWIDIVPEVLSFANEQIFAQLPKAELKQLKKEVEKATERVHEAQAAVIEADLDEAYERISAAKARLENARKDIEIHVKSLMRSTADAVARLSKLDSTRDIAVMIAGRRTMGKMMAEAYAAGRKYTQENTALTAECARVADLYKGYQSIVRGNKSLVSAQVDSMVESTKLNAETLQSWVTYLRSVQTEVKDGVDECGDMSDKGYMKNYNQVGSLMQDVLSGQ